MFALLRWTFSENHPKIGHTTVFWLSMKYHVNSHVSVFFTLHFVLITLDTCLSRIIEYAIQYYHAK